MCDQVVSYEERIHVLALTQVAPLTAMCDQVLDSDQPASDLAEEQMSVYVCIYIHVYIHVYIHIYAYIHVYVYVCVYNIYVYTHTHTHMCVCVCVCVIP